MRKKVNKRKVLIEIYDESVVCDICHSEEVFKTIKEHGHYLSTNNLDRVFFPGISKRIDGIEYSFDVCDKCFMEKVIPFLQSLGVIVKV